MLNVIIFSKNYKNYKSGYYHDDIVSSWQKKCKVFIYGPGYPGYNLNDTFETVLGKSGWQLLELDLIVISTSWDDDISTINVNPHPKINLSGVFSAKKIYYLNKEYKKLSLRFEFASENKIDLVVTVHPSYRDWERMTKIKFIQVHFGVNLSRFKYTEEPRKYDFGFTGGLHANHLDYRSLVKKEIFSSTGLRFKSNKEWKAFLRRGLLKKKYNSYNVYWAEFGSRDIFGRNLLPSGDSYAKFLGGFKCFLNTPSAVGIFNTRFFELMASKTLIVCPRVDSYDGILKDKVNCLMFAPDLSDFDQIIKTAVNDEVRNRLTSSAYRGIEGHSYDSRVQQVIEATRLLS